jgi:GNAT superfamily N-acetyltransferase
MTSVIDAQAAPPPVTIGEPTDADTPLVLDMVGRCSRSTLFHRFHGFTDAVDSTRALLARTETLVAWRDATCVGMATLAPAGDGTADLGVLVEDNWQRQGVGSRLIAAALETARRTGTCVVHAEVLGDDGFIVALLRRIGPIRVTSARGGYSVTLDLTDCLSA